MPHADLYPLTASESGFESWIRSDLASVFTHAQIVDSVRRKIMVNYLRGYLSSIFCELGSGAYDSSENE
jgi:hypothetical protein